MAQDATDSTALRLRLGLTGTGGKACRLSIAADPYAWLLLSWLGVQYPFSSRWADMVVTKGGEQQSLHGVVRSKVRSAKKDAVTRCGYCSS